ncbi:MAG TPA: lipid A biosynthesis acyltransferase [Chitinophagaceae bacterium]
MYPVVRGFFYLLSLLPWKILYFFSDCIYVLVYYVIGYRKEVVMQNLSIAFPEKTIQERKRIAKEFYHQLIDTFIETIKLISISKPKLRKHVNANLEKLDELYATGQSVVLTSGHFFNWEFANLLASAYGRYTLVGVYTSVSNKIFDRLMKEIRCRFGTVLIPVSEFRRTYPRYKEIQHAIGLIADQNPANPMDGFWYPFFGKMAPFAKGPERNAKSMNAAVVLVNFYRTKRGHYDVEFSELTTNPRETSEGEITRSLVHFVEKCVRENPSNYLWSHRRWKHRFDPEKHAHLVI